MATDCNHTQRLIVIIVTDSDQMQWLKSMVQQYEQMPIDFAKVDNWPFILTATWK